MTRPEVMLLCPARLNAMAQLEAASVLHRYDLAADRAAFLAEFGPRCRGVSTNGHAARGRALIAALPQLEIVSGSSAGV